MPAEYKPSAKEIAEEKERSDRAERLASALTGRATRGTGGGDSLARAATLGEGDGGTDALPEPGQGLESEPASRLAHVRRGVHLWAGIVFGVALVASLVMLCRGRGVISGIVLAVVLVVALAVWRGFELWMAPKPLCPKCRENVTRCEVRYCYICGKQTMKAHCDRCSVNESFWALDPFRPDGPITYCPSCGAHMGSDFRRCRPQGDA